jgi:hypothetical protein
MSLKFKNIKCGDLIELPSGGNKSNLKVIILSNINQGRYFVLCLDNSCFVKSMCIYEKYDTNLCV